MILWLDAHLSPLLASWMTRQFNCKCSALRELKLRSHDDREVFLAARRAGAVVVSKDRDFADLLDVMGAPPKVIWLRCGNRTNAEMQDLLDRCLPAALELLETEDIVEIV